VSAGCAFGDRQNYVTEKHLVRATIRENGGKAGRAAVRDGAEKTNALAGVVPFVLGVGLLVVNGTHGAIANVVIGALLVAQGLVNLVAPRLLPPMPGWSAERVRARRIAAIAPLTGAISFLAALLLFAVVPASERSTVTTLLAAVLLIAGLLGVVSGLGARKRAARLDSPPMSNLTDEIAE